VFVFLSAIGLTINSCYNIERLSNHTDTIHRSEYRKEGDIWINTPFGRFTVEGGKDLIDPVVRSLDIVSEVESEENWNQFGQEKLGSKRHARDYATDKSYVD